MIVPKTLPTLLFHIYLFFFDCDSKRAPIFLIILFILCEQSDKRKDANFLDFGGL